MLDLDWTSNSGPTTETHESQRLLLEDDAVRALHGASVGQVLASMSAGSTFQPKRHIEALELAWPWLLELDENPEPLHGHIAAVRSWKVAFTSRPS